MDLFTRRQAFVIRTLCRPLLTTLVSAWPEPPSSHGTTRLTPRLLLRPELYLWYLLLQHFFVVIRSPWTPTPSPTASTLAPASATLAGVLVRHWPYKGKVHSQGLVKQLGAVGALDGGFGFFLSGEFDECVALRYAAD